MSQSRGRPRDNGESLDKIETEFNPADIRARLLARIEAHAKRG